MKKLLILLVVSAIALAVATMHFKGILRNEQEIVTTGSYRGIPVDCTKEEALKSLIIAFPDSGYAAHIIGVRTVVALDSGLTLGRYPQLLEMNTWEFWKQTRDAVILRFGDDGRLTSIIRYRHSGLFPNDL